MPDNHREDNRPPQPVPAESSATRPALNPDASATEAGYREDDLQGRLVGHRYTIVQRIGEDALWTAWLGQDIKGGTPVAVKVMRDEVASEPDAIPRFLKQAEDAFKLNHPSIVRTLATGTEGGRHFLICDYVEGKNLRHWFDENTHSFSELRDKLKSACEALHYAHSNGVFHRSIRPENIFVDQEGQVRLADFGFAQRLEGCTQRTPAGSAVTSVAYVTPEQARGQRGDARSDLYMLGIVLYEMATGRVPFWDPDPVRIVYRHMHERPVPPRQVDPRVPAWMDYITMKLLEKDPAQRFQTARDVHQELLRIERQTTEGQFIELEASDPARARRVGGYAPLVGRADVEKSLRQMLTRTLEGRGRVALVSGEAGAGKTRVMSELATYAGLQGAVVLRGAATMRTRMLLGPFFRILHDYVRREEQRLADLVGESAGVLDCFLEGRLDEVLSHDPAAALARFEKLFIEFLERAAEQTPLVLVVEDVCRADEISLHLLRLIARRAARSRIMLLVTWRPENVGEGSAVAELLSDIGRIPASRRLELLPLDLSNTRTLLLHLTGAQDTSDELVEVVWASTRGIPMTIEEVVALQMREKLFHVVDGYLGCSAVDRVLAIQGLPALVEKRVANLPQKASIILTVAGCIGTTFDLDVLVKVAGKAPEEIASVLQWAQRNGWLEPEWCPGRERYHFLHEVLQAELYHALDGRSRKRLHLLAGMALEESYALRLRDVHEALAFHYRESDQWDKAVEYSMLAAERFSSLKALKDASFYYLQALDLLDHVQEPGSRRLACLKKLAKVSGQTGDEEGARRFGEQALRLARERRDADEEKEIRQMLAR